MSRRNGRRRRDRSNNNRRGLGVCGLHFGEVKGWVWLCSYFVLGYIFLIVFSALGFMEDLKAKLISKPILIDRSIIEMSYCRNESIVCWFMSMYRFIIQIS
mmetsp:Transcript_423/g.938  ORF Transcript_423/g.938 Transcript_423/m.938 type:complete len:101 (+) Transcript_423:495-797(+)